MSVDDQLHLSTTAKQELMFHAEGAYPSECAGLLAGDLASGTIAHVLLLPAQVTPTSFVVDPLVYLRGEDTARAMGLDILGIFHSHPDAAPVPSAADLIGAAGVSPGAQFVFVIQQVVAGRATHVRCWRRIVTGFAEVSC